MRAFKTRQGFVCATALAMSVASTVAPVHAEWWQERGVNAVEVVKSTISDGMGPLTVSDGMGDDDGLIQLALQLPATETTRNTDRVMVDHPLGLNQRDTRQVEFLRLLRSHFHEKAVHSPDKPSLENPGKGNATGGAAAPVGDPLGLLETPQEGGPLPPLNRLFG